jgi:hypothetical protein
LHTFPKPQQDAITNALTKGFTDGLNTVMWLSLGITVAGLVLVAFVMQRAEPIPDEGRTEELEEVVAEAATA